MRIFATTLLLALAGCAPDPVLGTFNFNMTGTDNQTAPNTATNAVNGTGTFAVTTGKSVDYLVTLSHVDSTPCVLDADLNDKRDAIAIAGGQECTFKYAGGQVTATLTSGSVSAAEKGETASVNVSYNYAGTIIGIPFSGSGTRTYAGVRR